MSDYSLLGRSLCWVLCAWATLAHIGHTAAIPLQYMFSLEATILSADPDDRMFGWQPTSVGSDKLLVAGTGKVYLFDLRGDLLMTFTNPIPSNPDPFGVEVAVFGEDRLLITAGEAAHLFNVNGQLLQSFRAPGDKPGWVRVARLGDSHVLLARSRYSLPRPNEVYVFNTNAVLVNTITNPAPHPGEAFGHSVAGVGADKVLVYVPWDYTVIDESGDCLVCGPVVYLMHTNGTHLATLQQPDGYGQDHYDLLAAAGQERIMLGGHDSDTPYSSAAVFLFSTAGTLITTFTNPASVESLTEWFGADGAALDSERYVISVYGDITYDVPGRVYLFGETGNVLGELHSPDSHAYGFGQTLDVLGDDRIVVGTIGYVYYGTNGVSWQPGSVRIYRVRPVLSASTTATNSVLLSWPASAAGYVLEEAASVGDAGWAEVMREPLLVNEEKQVAVAAGATRFYRLRKRE